MGENVRSDDEIASVRIGPPDVLDSQITLVDYDATWPQQFELEAARIRAALGSQALAVEHVGSTSVPGLAAKPRIDIVLVVADSSNESTYVPDLRDAGYVLRIREPDWYEHRVFKGPDTDVNLHVFSEGCPEIERMTLFRDHLRTNRDDRMLYERTKRDLAQRTWKYTQHYADAKAPVVEEILSRAARRDLRREAPPAMPDLTWRMLGREDLQALVELSRSCLAADGGLGFLFQPDNVRERYLPDVPGDSLGAFLADGRLVAAAAVHIHEDHGRRQPVVRGQVRPEFRNRGVGSYLMRWSETAADLLTVSTDRDVITLRTESLTDAADRLYRASGFEPMDVSLVMRRGLGEPLPDRSLPSDVTTVTWNPELAAQFAQAYEPAFADRPGFPGWSPAEWTSRVMANDLVSEWTLLARTVDTSVGFVIGCADSSITPPGGYVWQVGVAANQRKRGIGSALLVESMRRMQAAGSPSVQLVVNTDNSVGILAYEQLGFQTVGRRARYERRLIPER